MNAIEISISEDCFSTQSEAALSAIAPDCAKYTFWLSLSELNQARKWITHDIGSNQKLLKMKCITHSVINKSF